MPALREYIHTGQAFINPLRTKKSALRIERGPKLCYTTIMVCPAKGRIGL